MTDDLDEPDFTPVPLKYYCLMMWLRTEAKLMNTPSPEQTDKHPRDSGSGAPLPFAVAPKPLKDFMPALGGPLGRSIVILQKEITYQ